MKNFNANGQTSAYRMERVRQKQCVCVSFLTFCIFKNDYLHRVNIYSKDCRLKGNF